MDKYIARYSLDESEHLNDSITGGEQQSYVAENSFRFEAGGLKEASRMALQHALNQNRPTIAFTFEFLFSKKSKHNNI